MPPPLLIALDSEGHIHLVIGSNPLASARCAKSIEAGAKPIVIAPEDADVHYVLAKQIEDGDVIWEKKVFEDADISRLGRDEVDNVVDAVFVTSGRKGTSGMSEVTIIKGCILNRRSRHTHLQPLQTHANTSQRDRRSQSMYLHPSLYTQRRTSAYRHHHIWQRLQSCIEGTTRNRFIFASQLRRCDRTPRYSTAQNH